VSEETNGQQLVILTLGRERYAIPIQQVQEIIRYIQPRGVAAPEPSIRGVISLRGRIVPVYDLAARLGVAATLDEQAKIVIVESGSTTAGIVVDDVDEVLTIERDQIDTVSAAATSSDAIIKIGEQLVVLLDPPTICHSLEPAA
jgi:purine-binding chemotaxis protein CheW